MTTVVLHSDNLAQLREFPDEVFDAVVTDPPAGIEFMGEGWDSDKGGLDEWVDWLADVFKEVLRVLKPGGHGWVWALPRTSFWTGLALHKAGFEIRDRLTHLKGKGYAKNHRVSKPMEKKGLDEEATRWAGWATALKPLGEDWWLIRKPFEGTIADNVLQHGVGALHVDACRVDEADGRMPSNVVLSHHDDCVAVGTMVQVGTKGYPNGPGGNGWHGGPGRPPDGSRTEPTEGIPDVVVDRYACVYECPIRQLDAQGGHTKSRRGKPRKSKGAAKGWSMVHTGAEYTDAGGPSRFFYCAPPSRKEKEAGLEKLPERDKDSIYGAGLNSATKVRTKEQAKEGVDRGKVKNSHPTVKSAALMKYLVRMITPPGGTVLDPFCGSGTTGVACVAEGMNFVGIEGRADYVEISEARIAHTQKTIDATLTE